MEPLNKEQFEQLGSAQKRVVAHAFHQQAHHPRRKYRQLWLMVVLLMVFLLPLVFGLLGRR